MPNDAKLGLLVGVTGVLVAAVVYAPNREPPKTADATAPPQPAAVVPVGPPARAVVAAPPPNLAPLPATAGARPEVVGQVTSGRKPADD